MDCSVVSGIPMSGGSRGRGRIFAAQRQKLCPRQALRLQHNNRFRLAVWRCLGLARWVVAFQTAMYSYKKKISAIKPTLGTATNTREHKASATTDRAPPNGTLCGSGLSEDALAYGRHAKPHCVAARTCGRAIEAEINSESQHLPTDRNDAPT